MKAPMENSMGHRATPFEFGAGHMLLSKAEDPGLVYASNLNYPSLSIANLKGSITVKRTVTNVGKDNSIYVLKVSPPLGYAVDISPTTLTFSNQGEKQSFFVTVTANGITKRNEFTFGWYSWSDGAHVVRSPIVVSSA
nr:subtilisin-like protease SBT5.6 [Ipomoea batatas]